MIVHKKVKIPLYNGTTPEPKLHIIYCDEEGYNSVINDKSYDPDDEEDFEYNTFGALTFMKTKDGTDHFFMLFDKNRDLTISTLSHESYHLLNCIYISRCIKHDPHNDEPGAYLIGWINQTVYNILKKYIK